MKKLTITTRTFNDRSKAFLELKAQAETVDATLKGFKDAFLRFLRLHGVRPADAPKSRKYESDLYESLFSIGQKTEIVDAEVEKFMLAMADAKLDHLLDQIFWVESSYSLQPTAAETVKALPAKLRRAYARTQTTKPKTPVLTVKAKKQPPTKKELAEQEAACSA
jgi:hypothetical protein